MRSFATFTNPKYIPDKAIRENAKNWIVNNVVKRNKDLREVSIKVYPEFKDFEKAYERLLTEFQIVLARFIFSYEQTFMGDLVRFWYGSLFLFASSYALIHEGHVRVDVLYTKFSKRAKAWSNLFGCLLLGIPICWTIKNKCINKSFC